MYLITMEMPRVDTAGQQRKLLYSYGIGNISYRATNQMTPLVRVKRTLEVVS